APRAVRYDLQRARRLRIVRQGLAHPHQNHVGNPLTGAEGPAGFDDLVGDFARREVALESHYGRGAKCAAETATDLGGDTKGQPARLGNQHAFDGFTVAKTEKKLYRAVARFRAPHRLQSL